MRLELQAVLPPLPSEFQPNTLHVCYDMDIFWNHPMLIIYAWTNMKHLPVIPFNWLLSLSVFQNLCTIIGDFVPASFKFKY